MRDAQPVDPRPAGARRVEPRHVPVWIHTHGAWRKGGIHCWYVHDDQWMAWMQHDPPDDSPHATWGLYLYDGETIRQRHHPAAIAHVQAPSAWGPGRIIQTRLRDLGYSVAHLVTGDDWDELQLG